MPRYLVVFRGDIRSRETERTVDEGNAREAQVLEITARDDEAALRRAGGEYVYKKVKVPSKKVKR